MEPKTILISVVAAILIIVTIMGTESFYQTASASPTLPLPPPCKCPPETGGLILHNLSPNIAGHVSKIIEGG